MRRLFSKMALFTAEHTVAMAKLLVLVTHAIGCLSLDTYLLVLKLLVSLVDVKLVLSRIRVFLLNLYIMLNASQIRQFDPEVKP